MIKYIRAVIVCLLLIINLSCMGLMVLLLALLNMLTLGLLQNSFDVFVNTLYRIWVKGNKFCLIVILGVEIDPILIKKQKWTVMICNHQSWMDILLLQILFVDTLPPLKFFMKQSLIWVPFVGVVAKLLNYPFIKRYSVSEVKRNPKLKMHNEQSMTHACKQLLQQPTALVNFLEGTRFTVEKHKIKSSSYKFLLPAHSKGLGHVFTAWFQVRPNLCNVAIKYNHADPSFAVWLLGGIRKVEVFCQVIDFDDDWVSDGSSGFKLKLQKMVNKIWQNKDHWLEFGGK